QLRRCGARLRQRQRGPDPRDGVRLRRQRSDGGHRLYPPGASGRLRRAGRRVRAHGVVRMSAENIVYCPPFHVSDTGLYYEGCGQPFEAEVGAVGTDTEGSLSCPHCGLVYDLPEVPFGVHWSGVEGDPIACTDLPFYDFDESEIPDSYEGTS